MSSGKNIVNLLQQLEQRLSRKRNKQKNKSKASRKGSDKVTNSTNSSVPDIYDRMMGDGTGLPVKPPSVSGEVPCVRAILLSLTSLALIVTLILLKPDVYIDVFKGL